MKPGRLTLTEGLSLVFKMAVLAPPALLLTLLRTYTLATLRGIPLRHFALCVYYPFGLSTLTPRQLQFIKPPTLNTYKTWLTKRKTRAVANSKPDSTNNNNKEAAFLASRLAIDTEPLPDGQSSLLWIGDRHRATKFVYFLHGGGYVAPAQDGHMEWCARAYLLASPAAVAAGAGGNSESEAGEEGEEVAVAVLQYTLCPYAQYPDQLRQAADGLAHLLASGRVTPGNLVIGGDSAGGNLTAQMLGHLQHPHPDAKEIVLAEPLAGAFLVSPWVSGRNHWGSVERNRGIDMISEVRSPRVRGLVQAERREGDESWVTPLDLEDPEGWFRGLERVVKEVYVTAGEQEIIRDQTVAFADAVRRGNPGVTVKLDVSRNEAHDWILLEGQQGEDGDATRRMRAWFRGLFWP